MRFRVARIADAAAARSNVGEALAGSAPADARLLVGDVGEAGMLGCVFGIDNRFCGAEIEGHRILYLWRSG